MTKHLKEMTSKTEYKNILERFLQKIFSKGYNNIEEQLDVYGTEDKANFYQASLINMGGWTAPAKVCGHVMLNYENDVAIADIGCGTGMLGKIFKAGNYHNVDGYDLSQAMVDISKPYYQTVKMCNIIEAPLDKKYDVITASGILTRGHVDATAAPMLAKSLKPSGELVAHHPLFDDYDYQVEAGWTTQTHFEVKDRKKFVGYIYNGKNVECELVIYKLRD